jgi:hypothetical protein
VRTVSGQGAVRRFTIEGETSKSKGWFMILRICVLLEAWLDKTSKPGEAKLVK